MLFSIADFIVEVLFSGTDTRDVLSPRSYKPFWLADESSASTDRLFVCELVDDGLGKDIAKELGQFESAGVTNGVFTRHAGGYFLQVRNVEGQLAALVETTADFARLRVQLFGDLNNRRYGLNNAMMIGFAFSSALHHTLLIHASVTMKEGRGYLFLGRSGTGKSTHSRQWLENISGTELLNDDNPAVRLHSDGIARVYGTPWSGKTPCYKQQSATVGAFVRIVQHPENLISRDPAPLALSSILSSSSTMIWDKQTYSATCNTIAKILASTPAYTLRCRPEPAAAYLCHDTVYSA
ncbi:MAG: hypothetical protein Q4A44_04550 [Bacteroidales bacterium]|nr:hypothetical protein [Bacteroidales bacterium]